MVRIVFAFLFLCILMPGNARSQDRITDTVTAVPSGDEIVVGTRHVRLQGIAAPPRRMPFGGDATAFLGLLVLEKVVTCDLTGETTRGREVGSCFLDGIDIARVIVREGLARDCPRFSRGRYAQDEQNAKPTGLSEVYPLPAYCGRGI